MLTNAFKDKMLSRLGFGAMRLPQNADGTIDEEQVFSMTDYAMEHGINYFDTAYPYHGGRSEIVMGKALARYPRESYYLADKYPGHQIAETYDPAALFEEQLKKCGVEYFDFYLLHNVCENSMNVYLDEKWGIIPYFIEQRKLGRIKHLGFSSHANIEALEGFLDRWGDEMEFCQIQLNYLDWTLQRAKQKYELLTARGIPVWVMEPVRGGKLANLPEEHAAKLTALREESQAAWAFRYLITLPNVKVILSGMSNMAQIMDNVATFEGGKPQTAEETALLMDIAEQLKDSVPCTACRYCCKGCPMELDIPMLIAAYNDLKFSPGFTSAMQIEALPEGKKPADCIACGQCTAACPQGIDVPGTLSALDKILAGMPTWAELCRQRAEAARKMAEAEKEEK